MNASAHRQAGFTLVELLVSLAILGMMAAMLLSGLVTGRRVWERVEHRTQAGEDVMAAQDAVRALVRRSVALGSLDGSRTRVLFTGDERQMQFISAAPDALAPMPPMTYRLGLSAGGALTLDRLPDLATDDSGAVTRLVLARGIAGLEFSYFGPTPPDNNLRWRSRWVRQSALPRLVRIRASYRQGDKRVWPDLIVQPSATIDTLCVYTPATGRCRGRT